MTERCEKLTLMKDILDHMGDCCDGWQSAEGPMQRFFADAIRRDLSEFRRVCESLCSQQPLATAMAY